MVIHAGANTTSKKVAEYGGNTFGFGSRSVLGSGWPKDLVRVSLSALYSEWFDQQFTNQPCCQPMTRHDKICKIICSPSVGRL